MKYLPLEVVQRLGSTAAQRRPSTASTYASSLDVDHIAGCLEDLFLHKTDARRRLQNQGQQEGLVLPLPLSHWGRGLHASKFLVGYRAEAVRPISPWKIRRFALSTWGRPQNFWWGGTGHILRHSGSDLSTKSSDDSNRFVRAQRINLMLSLILSDAFDV